MLPTRRETNVSCVDEDSRPPTGLAWTNRRPGPSVPAWALSRLAASRHHGLRVGKCVFRHSRERVPGAPSSAVDISTEFPHGLRETPSRS